MFFSAATGLAVSTPEGRFLHANAAYCRMLGDLFMARLQTG
jgi:PAS domain-containing protein